MMFGGGGILMRGFPHVNVTPNPHPHEHFNVELPFRRRIGGFHPPMLARVVATPIYPPRGGRPDFQFGVNIETESEIFLQFNVRFHEGRVIRNSTKDGRIWQVEEHDGGFPFENGRVFTLDFIAESESVKVTVDGEHFVDFSHRGNPAEVGQLSVYGDLRVHLVGVSHHHHHYHHQQHHDADEHRQHDDAEQQKV